LLSETVENDGRYTFGPFLLDSEARVLLREGEPVPLAGKTFDTLLVLVQNRGRLMDKDELLARVWPGTLVEEANLSQNIFTIRKILGDSPKDHRYIATVAGRGYQFVAPVTETVAEPSEMPAFQRRNLAIRAAAVVLVVALAATAWFCSAPRFQILRRTTGKTSDVQLRLEVSRKRRHLARRPVSRLFRSRRDSREAAFERLGAAYFTPGAMSITATPGCWKGFDGVILCSREFDHGH
jgi:DNA-binding winged helix-turn-helix (wHTH) protein